MVSSQMKENYIRVFVVLVIIGVIIFITNIGGNPAKKTMKKSTSAVKSIDSLIPDWHRNVPREVYECANRTDKVFKYDFSTDLYILPSKVEMCLMSLQELGKLYQMYLSTIQTICKRPIRLGNRADGGWDLCSEKQYITPGACLVYSFGINYDYSFDDDVAKELDCKVHSFDPSMDQKSYLRSEKPYVYFHDLGISSTSKTVMANQEWRLLSLKDIRTELHHEQLPDVIKIDIEYWEWDVLPDVLSSDQLPKQFVIEFHVWGKTKTDQKFLWLHRLRILKDLYDAGYRIFWLNRNCNCIFISLATNNHIYGCHEVSFIKIADDVRKTAKNV